MSFLTDAQYQFLIGALHPSRVSVLKGNNYLEQWDVRRHLIRVFGFGGWNFERIACELVAQIEHQPGTVIRRDSSGKDYANDRALWTVIYRYEGRLSVAGADGTRATYEDAAAGDAANQPSLGDAHDQALKAAASGALKRCAVNFGDQFGLGLYSGRPDPVVLRSLVAPPPATQDKPADAGEKTDEPTVE